MHRCIAGILVGISIAASSLDGQVPVVSGPPQIATTGVGEASAVPDRATIYIAVQTRAPTASAASADNARRVKAVIDTLRLIGIAGDQVQTANYNVSPEMSYPTTPSQAPRTVAYTVTNSLLLKLKRIDDVARAIDAALARRGRTRSPACSSRRRRRTPCVQWRWQPQSRTRRFRQRRWPARRVDPWDSSSSSVRPFRCAPCRWCKHSRRGRRSRRRSCRESSRSARP